MVMASDFIGGYSCITSKEFIKQNPNYSVFFTALFQYMTDEFETEESYGFSISNILEISPGFTKFVSDGKFDDILRHFFRLSKPLFYCRNALRFDRIC